MYCLHLRHFSHSVNSLFENMISTSLPICWHFWNKDTFSFNSCTFSGDHVTRSTAVFSLCFTVVAHPLYHVFKYPEKTVSNHQTHCILPNINQTRNSILTNHHGLPRICNLFLNACSLDSTLAWGSHSSQAAE